MTPEQINDLRAEVVKHKLAAHSVEARLAEFKGVDPDHYKALKTEVETMRREARAAELHSLATQGDYEAFKARYDIDRESEMQELRAQLAAATEKSTALEQQQVDREQKRKSDHVEKGLSAALDLSGAINPKIVKQLINDTHDIELDETADSATIYVTDKNSNIRQTAAQLISDLRMASEYGHLFKEPDSFVQNPWQKETLNLTEQGKILRKNPELAMRLMNEAKGSVTKTDSNPWRKETLNLTEQGRIHRINPQLAQRLKQEAKQ
jgi:hypothetical protein